MKTNNEKYLGFVLKYYHNGALDTKSAMKRVMLRAGMPGRTLPLRRFAVAAAVVLLVAGAALVWWSHAFGTVEVTASNVVQTVLLPDGTSIVMQPGTSLSYKRNEPRNVRMLGTAYFSVHHDAEHPFTVSNTISTVRVLGTKFEVESPRTARTEVYVSEGRVLFAAAGSTRGVVLTRGMKARLDNGDRTPDIVPPGSINQITWATGVFHFNNTPLSDVLRDLSAYYKVPLSTTSTAKRLTGDIRAERLDSVLNIIEQTLDVVIIKN